MVRPAFLVLVLGFHAACGSDVEGGDESQPEPSKVGQVCTSSADCGPGEYCHQIGYGCADDQDGFPDECRLLPTACPAVVDPVCACDDVVYDNECLANAAGQSVAMYHSCAPPQADLFSCGAWFCTIGEDYCVEVFEAGFHCEALPASCSTAVEITCDACFGDQLPPDCSACYDDAPGALELSCGGL